MSETVAQLIASAILLLVAGGAGYVGYRIGRKRGVKDALQMSDALRDVYSDSPPEQTPDRPEEKVH